MTLTIHSQGWSSRKPMTFGVLTLAFILGIVCSVTPAAAATYYVSPAGNDGNPGTQSTPWRTIGKAAATLVAGDTAILMDGTYTEPQITFRNSGTAAMPITVRAQNKHRAILSSTSGCNPNISISASYVTIQDIRSVISPYNVICGTGVNSASGTAVRCWQANMATVSNPTTGYAGCTVRGTLIDGSPARGHAIKTNQDFSLLEDNIVYSGIEALNSYGTVFRNNTIIGGDAWGSSLASKGGVRNFQAYNNVVRVRTTWGIGIALGGSTDPEWLFDPSSGMEAYNSVAYNNVVINESGSSILALGMMGAANSEIFNNVVIGNGLYIRNGRAPQQSSNPVIKNNIVVCNGKPAFDALAYAGSLIVDYNDFYGCTGNPSQAHPIIGNPLFVDSASDWHLTSGSPGIGSGTVVGATGYQGETMVVNKDKDGNVRTTPWDLGIYATRVAAPDATPPAPPAGLRVS